MVSMMNLLKEVRQLGLEPGMRIRIALTDGETADGVYHSFTHAEETIEDISCIDFQPDGLDDACVVFEDEIETIEILQA